MYKKRLFRSLALSLALCISLCISTISYAVTIKSYKEIKYDCPIKKLKLISIEAIGVDINNKGMLQFYIYNGTNYFVTYNSKGKKTVEKDSIPYDYDKEPETMGAFLYGGHTYQLWNENVLRVYNKKGKLVKKITLKEKKYRKRKKDRIYFRILEITRKNVVRVRYSVFPTSKKKYSGIIDVNISTGKIKKVIDTDFVFTSYDGKNKFVYYYEYNKDKVTFYSKSIKTKKTRKFTIEEIIFDEDKYPYSNIHYSIYNEKVMAVSPDGRVFYGTYDSKKLEQIGDISKCKNFKKYECWDIAMKNKNEFYIAYAPAIKKGEEYDHSFGKVFIAKYIKM